MQFVNKLDTVLKNGGTKGMTARYTSNSLTACASLDSTDALKEWQGELLNNTLLDILKPDEETDIFPHRAVLLEPVAIAACNGDRLRDGLRNESEMIDHSGGFRHQGLPGEHRASE